MVLIYPPVAKISEPPPGVAILAGALKEHNIPCKVIDANLDGMLWLSKKSSNSLNLDSSSWNRRAVKNLDNNISALKNIRVYKNIDQYRQKVLDLNRAITIAPNSRFTVTLSDYTDSNLTPLKSQDLLISASRYQENPFYQFFETDLSPKIDAHSSDYIGISVCYLSQALIAFALAGWIRDRFSNKKIIMGGGLITSWLSMPTWSEPFKGLIDLMVKGKGEERLIELLAPSNFEADNKIEIQRHKPDFDFCQWTNYISPGSILPFRTATGCYWRRCRFCPERAEGTLYRAESSSRLLSNLNYLVDRYNVDYIHFLDDAISPGFLNSFATQNIFSKNWYGFVRFNQELKSQEFCKALYRSGCRLLKIGLESGDQSVLDKMEKGTDLDFASQILKNLKDAGIGTYVYLLFGTAFEDEAAANKTLDYVTTHSDYISFLNLAIFNLPRFSEDAANLETELFSEGDLSLYLSFKHPKGWDRKKVRLFLDRQFKRAPAISKILKRDPPVFTSNHAMFVV
ncbi:MAG: radical SAM protein [Desulfamplus sp.]|nr:radical SAM protein [Desulfamplus sp.]